jgi:hypothetical protein
MMTDEFYHLTLTILIIVYYCCYLFLMVTKAIVTTIALIFESLHMTASTDTYYIIARCHNL